MDALIKIRNFMNYLYIWFSLTLVWGLWKIISSPSTKLHKLVLNGDLDKLKSYLDGGTNPDINKNNGMTPLYTAICDGNLAAVELLISYGANVNWGIDNHKYNDFLLAAIDNSYLEIADVLITNSAEKGIHYFSFSGDIFQISQLIAVDSNAVKFIRNGGKTALHYAVLGNQKCSVQLLMQLGANINHSSLTEGTPIHLAIKGGDTDILEYLLGYDVSQVNLDIGLNCAVVKSNLNMVNMLILKKANVNYCTSSIDPALFLAVESRNKSIASVLLENGASINQKVFMSGNTAIHAAVLNNDITMTELLIEYGADVDAMSNFGSTPLGLVHRSIGCEELEKLLIKYNASNFGIND
jgi:ankyrin repeat protein